MSGGDVRHARRHRSQMLPRRSDSLSSRDLGSCTRARNAISPHIYAQINCQTSVGQQLKGNTVSIKT